LKKKKKLPQVTKKHPKRKDSGGLKFDDEKPPFDLIPYEALEEIAKVLKHGMIKYQRANWAKGIAYSRLIAAAMRHLNQYNSVCDKDEESGLDHASHAATNLVFLLWMIKNRPDLDDRWIKNVKKSKLSSRKTL
jgi:hypothetical protein